MSEFHLNLSRNLFSVPEFTLLIYGIDLGLWVFQNTGMYSTLHFQLYNYIACSCKLEVDFYKFSCFL